MSSFNKSLVVFCLVVARSLSVSQQTFQDSHDEARVVNGDDASYGQFPYFVSIEHEICSSTESGSGDDDESYLCDICGGALIGVEWVLTAAHCVKEAHMVNVYLGIIYDGSADINYEVTGDEISIHPGYDSDTHKHDLALLSIPTTDLCDTVNIVSLPKLISSAEYQKYTNKYAFTCGFGETATEGYSERLQWALMRIIDNTDCAQYLDVLCITKEMICADSPINLSSSSHGDSGGPLVLESTGELVGVVVAISKMGADKGYPVVFARVTDYLEWIKSVSGIYYED